MKLASIEKILEVFPHPNAESLEFVKVLGYQCIVPKGKWSQGNWCILIQPDTVLPNAGWAEFYKRNSPKRVKALKLRGMWSFGIVEDISILPFGPDHFEGEGMDVSEFLGIIKYEEPEPVDRDAESGFPWWMRKTGEDMWQTLPLETYYGKLVDVTLKLDGKSMSIFNYEGKQRVCSRRLVFKPECDNSYMRVVQTQEVFNKLTALQEICGQNLVFRGELFQGEFYLFGVYRITTRENFGPNSEFYFKKVAERLNINSVPIIEKQVPLTLELIQKYQNMDKLDGNPFEGVVIVGDTFSFKVINLNYDSKK